MLRRPVYVRRPRGPTGHLESSASELILTQNRPEGTNRMRSKNCLCWYGGLQRHVDLWSNTPIRGVTTQCQYPHFRRRDMITSQDLLVAHGELDCHHVTGQSSAFGCRGTPPDNTGSCKGVAKSRR